jgi:hypothetical protein
MRVESGPAKADRNWQLVRAVLFLGFALYFVYDGAIGWPNKIEKEAKDALKQPDPFGGQIAYDDLAQTPQEPDLQRLKESNPTKRSEVEQALGEAQLTKPLGNNQSTSYYVSKWGYAVASYNGNTVRSETLKWEPWYKTKGEVQQQFMWALIPGVLALPFLWKLYKAVTLHVVVNDEGMDYSDKRIAFADMVSLRDYNPKGWIDLYYKDGGREKKLRLDNEKVLLFDEVIEAICEKTGFKNEVRAYGADVEDEEETPDESVAQEEGK